MYKIFMPFLAVSFLLTGCSQKLNEYAKPTDILHEQALTQTQKTVLKRGLKTKMFFVTTYVNHIDQNLIAVDEKVERFIVSAYVPDNEDKTMYDKIIFLVNGKKPMSVNRIKPEDEQLSILPSTNPWSKYYMVQAPVDDTKRGISFEAEVKGIGKTKIEFHDRYGNLPMGGSIGFKTDFDK